MDIEYQHRFQFSEECMERARKLYEEQMIRLLKSECDLVLEDKDGNLEIVAKRVPLIAFFR